MSMRPTRPEELSWMTERSAWVPSANTRGILQECDGKINAMVAYDEWTPNAARIHVAIENPLACREFVRVAFEYPFLETGRDVLWTAIPAHNTKCIRLVQRLGFVETHKILGGWNLGVSLCFFELRKSQCTWLNKKKVVA